MSNSNGLINAGLTNTNSEDLGIIATSKPLILKAFCSSRKCTGDKYKPVIKSVDKSTDTCPDCGNSLFFKRVRSEYHSPINHI